MRAARGIGWLLAALALVALWAWQQRAAPVPSFPASTPAQEQHVPEQDDAGIATRRPHDAAAFLPDEAFDTLRRIERGGPFPHRQDGGTFQNRERRLPTRPRGHYREYTVATPGARDRGARRIVTGGDPPSEFFYTGDHYRSFRRLAPADMAAAR